MKAKIQRSMLLVLFVTILIFYGLLTLVMYQKNLTLLKEEVNQERIGDHATNIAEWVEFSITGVHRNGVNV